MYTYFKRVRKLSYLYFICLIAFFIISIGFIGVFGDESYANFWMPAVSCFVWFYGIYAWYLEGKKMGKTDKLPFYKLKLNPFRGLLIGTISMIVITIGAFVISYILVVLYSILSLILVQSTEPFTWSNSITSNTWKVLIKFSYSPFYWMANLAGNKIWQYAVAALSYPASLMTGYSLGLYRSSVEKLKKEINKNKNS
jgi:hypothetical protein